MSRSRESWRISGKRVWLPEALGDWKLSPRPGGWWIAERGSERRRIFVFESRGRLCASLGGRLWNGEVQGHSRGSSAGGADAQTDLAAQFPGKVRKLLIQAGARVREGDPLILVEAMKMEFSVKAPAHGKVRAVLVREGQQLSPGDRFVDFEVEGSGEEGSE